jgi:hypothetical protein
MALLRLFTAGIINPAAPPSNKLKRVRFNLILLEKVGGAKANKAQKLITVPAAMPASGLGKVLRCIKISLVYANLCITHNFGISN